MEKRLYDEMVNNINNMISKGELISRKIFLFAYCNATLELVDLLYTKGIRPTAILDNSKEKQGLEYKGISVVSPERIMGITGDGREKESIVLIASRFYEAMVRQLREIGYDGPVRKVIDYNTYADYSLSVETIARMKVRERHGNELLHRLSLECPGSFKVFCPFNALGDIYFMMSYWYAFAKKRKIVSAVFCVPNRTLADVIHMFGDYIVKVYEQKELDAMIQSAIYTRDENCFIAHQDRPYVVNLHKALYVKKIPLEQIYCCGVYGLPPTTQPMKPNANREVYKEIDIIPEGKAVIVSPYAKSVTAIDLTVWERMTYYFISAGYKVFTNVVGDERPLERTEAISPSILEMRSVVERAGTFVGIRSGLCDILREAKAKKIALYPDYNYGDTKWKAIDLYHIDQFDHNLLATEEIKWERL